MTTAPKFPETVLIESLLRQIADKLTQAQPGITCGLFSGEAGIALFFACLYLHSGKEEYGEKAIELLEKIIEEVAAQGADASLSSGMAGIGWLVQHLVNIGLLQPEDSELLADVDEMIMETLGHSSTDNNWDLLYGLIGKGIYFLERFPSPMAQQALEHITEVFAATAISTPGGICWKDIFTESAEEGYNLGLAHGVPSVIAFLARVYHAGIQQEKIALLLRDSTRWLLAQQQTGYDSLFASNTAQCGNSRLGWCYGDAGIAVALYHAAVALQDRQLEQQALNIALHAANRNMQTAQLHCHPETGKPEAGICHGSAGLAHLFNQFYRISQRPHFAAAATYWLELALQAYDEHASQSGYLCYQLNPDTQQGCWNEDSGLLNGAAGVGLVLLSFLAPSNTGWSRPFLLEFENLRVRGLESY